MKKLLFSLLALLVAGGCIESPKGLTTVYAVRHAEKAPGRSKDPHLSKKGAANAEALAELLLEQNIQVIYSSHFRRTRETVAPLARQTGRRVRKLGANKVDELAQAILNEHRGKRILVAGHSNTIPQLLKALGIEEDITIGENDYGEIYVVSINADDKAVLTKRRFGD